MKYLKALSLSLFCLLLIPSFSQDLIDKEELITDLTYLASDDLGGRGTGTEGNKASREFIADRFEKIGANPIYENYFQSFSVKTKDDQEMKAYNVIGQIKGSTDKKIIITAHYDHLGTRDGKIYNGADDNASGVAGMLAIARYYSVNKPQNTLLFIAFDAEEMGLRGARYFTKNLPFEKDDVILNINLDMVGRDDNNRIYAAGGSHYPKLKSVLEKIKEQAPVTLMMGNDQPSDGHNDWTYSSDHGPFHQMGIPFIYFGVEDHKDYHKHTDTADKIKPDFISSTVQTILMTVDEIDKNFQ